MATEKRPIERPTKNQIELAYLNYLLTMFATTATIDDAVLATGQLKMDGKATTISKTAVALEGAEQNSALKRVVDAETFITLSPEDVENIRVNETRVDATAKLHRVENLTLREKIIFDGVTIEAENQLVVKKFVDYLKSLPVSMDDPEDIAQDKIFLAEVKACATEVIRDVLKALGRKGLFLKNDIAITEEFRDALKARMTKTSKIKIGSGIVLAFTALVAVVVSILVATGVIPFVLAAFTGIIPLAGAVLIGAAVTLAVVAFVCMLVGAWLIYNGSREQSNAMMGLGSVLVAAGLAMAVLSILAATGVIPLVGAALIGIAAAVGVVTSVCAVAGPLLVNNGKREYTEAIQLIKDSNPPEPPVGGVTLATGGGFSSYGDLLSNSFNLADGEQRSLLAAGAAAAAPAKAQIVPPPVAGAAAQAPAPALVAVPSQTNGQVWAQQSSQSQAPEGGALTDQEAPRFG